jgi:hypothetical protein
MEFATDARQSFDSKPKPYVCQAKLNCRHRGPLYVVAFAQMDIESAGPVYSVVCSLHKSKLVRDGAVVVAEEWPMKCRR